MLTVGTILDHLERFAPRDLAADWDNVGLLLGERGAPVRRLMTCLTVTPDSAAEAIDKDVQLIVTHHPILFKAVKRLTDATPEGRMVLRLVRAGVAVYSPHTAFDNTRDGINEQIAVMLGLQEIAPLRRRPEPPTYKVVVFTPDKDLQKVSDAMFAAGAGQIGQYRECSFRLAGTGTFFGTEATKPTVGQKGRREEAPEWRLEVICPDRALTDVLSAMRRAHSYEEPAYDVYSLHPGLSGQGEGRIGVLEQPLALEELASRVKAGLRAAGVQVVGEPARAVRRVAIVCGAGGELLMDAIRVRADVFLTGEMRFHDMLAVKAHYLAALLPGHYASERPGVEALATRLQQHWPELQVWASREEKDPAVWL